MDNIFKKTIDKIKGAFSDDELTELDAKTDSMWSVAESARKEIDWKWFNYDLFVTGNHYARWNKYTQQIVTAPKLDGRPKITINKVFTTLRGVRSYVLQNRPKAEVTPFDTSEENLDETIGATKYLDYLHDRQHLRTKLRASMWHALKYSVGFWQVLPDDDPENADRIIINVVDPYDLYWDPIARYPSEARYVILAVRKNIEDLKDDPKYKDVNWNTIQSDNQMAASTLKARIMEYERGQTPIKGGDTEAGTAIVKEFWYKEKYNAEEEEEYEEEDKDSENEGDEETPKVKKTRKITSEKMRIMICTKIGNQIIRKPEDTGLNRFPFFRLPSDIEPLAMYGTGWVKNIVPANKLLNRLESSWAEYNDVVNKARILADKGAGVNVISNQHGTMVEKKRGFTVEAMPVPQIDGASLTNQIANANRYIEDLGSLHDASAGRIPTGAKSGVAIEALQEGDSNNLSELVENTEEFLEDVYEYILYLASKQEQFARNIVTTTQLGEKEYLKIIGEEAAPDLKEQEGVTVIKKKNIVDVKIASYLAYSAEGKRQAMKDLTSLPQMANLPPEYILQAYSIGPIADILKKMREEQEQQQKQQLAVEQAKSQQQTQASIATQQAQQAMQPQPNLPGSKEAIAFIRMLINGQKPQLPAQVSQEFVQYLDQFMQSQEAQSLGPEFLKILQTERDQAMLHLVNNPANVKGGQT